MTFLGHLGGPWRTVGDFFGSLGGSLGDNGWRFWVTWGVLGGQWVTFLGHLGGPWGTMGDFYRSLGGYLGDN